MTKPILYGMHLSPPVRAVLLVAKAIDLDLEFREVNLLTLENRKPEFTEKNPQRTVPTLDDGGLIIWDSHAIATYLIGKYGKDDSLYPKDLYKRAVIDQRLHFDSGILFVRLRAITESIFFNNNSHIPPEKINAIDEAYAFMEQFVAKTSYLVGNTVTVADLCCIATISSTQGINPINPKKHPKLAAWMTRMEELPYYEEINGRSAKKLIKLINIRIEELQSQS